jgi:hypothetical protein
MVISQNDMNFEPRWADIVSDSLADSCNIQWRISQVGCWSDYYWNPDWQKMEKDKNPKPLGEPNQYPYGRGYTIYEPCDTTICCARQLEVCRYGLDSVKIQDLGSLTEGGDCDTVFAHPPRIALQCYDVCDFLKDLNELQPKMPEKNEPEQRGFVLPDTVKITNENILIVYYTQTTLKILLDNIDASHIDVSIYNFTGKLTINKTQRLISGRSLIDMDISCLTTRVYIYSITSDGILVKTGKFYIIK